ncbi:MAG TPA: hypothetical protein EYP23_01365 [Thermoplasmata archaeon]|nr:hypothetical protein [Thermoplasmata archaeon]
MKVVTFLTDFGEKDTYVAEMKGVILGITRDVKIVDITHQVTPHSVEEGAFLLLTAVPYFPQGTIHVAVVDPGVGTERKGIIVKTRVCTLVGPDNGLLIPVAKKLGDFKVFEIINKKYMLPSITHTFHGRDVFAPVAAYLAKGVDAGDIGRETKSYLHHDFDAVRKVDGRITGRVVHIDRFGNVVTNIDGDIVLRYLRYGGKTWFSVSNKKHRAPFVKAYGFVEKNETLLTVGGTGFLELSINQGNAAEKLNVKTGDSVTLFL